MRNIRILGPILAAKNDIENPLKLRSLSLSLYTCERSRAGAKFFWPKPFIPEVEGCGAYVQAKYQNFTAPWRRPAKACWFTSLKMLDLQTAIEGIFEYCCSQGKIFLQTPFRWLIVRSVLYRKSPW